MDRHYPPFNPLVPVVVSIPAVGIGLLVREAAEEKLSLNDYVLDLIETARRNRLKEKRNG